MKRNLFKWIEEKISRDNRDGFFVWQKTRTFPQQSERDSHTDERRVCSFATLVWSTGLCPILPRHDASIAHHVVIEPNLM
jgi:hypothetical protein